MEPQISIRGLLSYAASFFSQVPLSPTSATDNVTPYEPLSGGPSCPIDGPVSCQKTPPEGIDSCCYIAPSGRMLLAQFWDQQVHAGGTEEDWTLHGLWPDLCDGTYKAYCGMTPHFENITEILEHHDQGELVQHMNRYWVAAYGSNSHLWAHEYNKHASCINTLRASCYADAYAPGVEVVDYFTRAFQLFRSLDSYRALERAGITPSRERKYPLKDVQAAMEEFSGGKVVLRCSGRGRATLHEAWYVFFVQRSLQSGEFIPAQDYGAHGDVGNCADEIWYLPKVCRLPGGCPLPGDGEL